ncbi:hypothetical protein GL2_36530 [Microbulbifer sp. GL-2]|nr:hypothetical protein GL2_36530 [Microbulbifer sp. GL-2]
MQREYQSVDGAEFGTINAEEAALYAQALEAIPGEGVAAKFIATKAAGLVLMRNAKSIPASLVEQISLSPNIQRMLLRSALGTAKEADMVAHHIIPLEAIKAFPELMKKAAHGGFNMNGVGNGIHLKNVSGHYYGHPVYNKAVLQELSVLNHNLSNMSAPRAAFEVQQRANMLRDSINAGTFGPWQ